MPQLQFYRNDVLIISPNTLSADYSGMVMGENKVNAKFILNEAFDFHVNDYIIHRGKRYSIAEAPTELRDANRRFTYDIPLEAPEYKLYNKQFRHLNSGTFSFTGTAVEMLDLIIVSAGSPWLTGEYEETNILTVQFDKDSCRTALTKVAEAFGLEYEFTVDFEINLVKSVGTLIPGVVFQYGKNKGLYNLTRQPIADNSFGTRFFGYGSSDNLPADYRSGATQLQFDGYFVETSNIDPLNPIERNADFPDIKPGRTGTITASVAVGTNQWSVTDPTMDFDLNDVIVNGEAKIVFKTGMLAGNEFQITFYDNTTKVITFNVNVESSGYILPNVTVNPVSGDTYTFIGISMPTSYVTDAEARLLAATIEYAEANSTPKIAYQLAMDKLFIKANGLTTTLSFGDKIGVKDDAMGTDVVLRISNITYSLFDEAKINATISEEIVYNNAQKIVKAVVNNANDINNVEQQTIRAKNEADNARRTAQIVAGKTNFLTTTIDENVIATGTLIVGNASGDNNAGISGVEETVIADSVRFWAGDTYANRTIAPWRVYQDGRTVMTKATIQSSDGSKAIIISADDNNLKFKVASVDVLVIDDDNVIENIDNTGPTPVITYGAGMSIGDTSDVDESTLVGRKLIVTPRIRTGELGDAGYSAMSKDGIITTGNLQADGVTNVSDLAISGTLSTNAEVGKTVTYTTYIDSEAGSTVLKFVNGLLVI